MSTTFTHFPQSMCLIHLVTPTRDLSWMHTSIFRTGSGSFSFSSVMGSHCPPTTHFSLPSMLTIFAGWNFLNYHSQLPPTHICKEAGLSSEALTSHCFCHGGVQYWLIHATVTQHWSLEMCEGWVGWAAGAEGSRIFIFLALCTTDNHSH